MRNYTPKYATTLTVWRVCLRMHFSVTSRWQVDDDPSTMSMLQFTNFANGCRLLESKGLNSVSDLDLIFLRAARPLPTDGPPPLLEAVEGSGVAMDAGWKKLRAKGLQAFKAGIHTVIQQNNAKGANKGAKGANMLTQTQFVGALVRLASQMFASADPLALRLSRLCDEHISGHVFDELRLVEDDLDGIFRGRRIGAVLDMHGGGLREVFVAYAAADTLGDGTAEGRKAACASTETMNVRELSELCDDVAIFDRNFTTMQLLAIFCKVNIDDDVFEQEEAQNSASELVYDEFEEVLVRIFHAAVFLPMQQTSQTANLLDQDGDGDLDDDDIDELYEECDTDGSGTISLAELTEALKRRLNAGAAVLVAKKLVRIADEDGEGTLTREELREAIHMLSSRGGGVADNGEEELTLEQALHEWLGGVFLPTARTAAKKKKLAVVAAKMQAAAAAKAKG